MQIVIIGCLELKKPGRFLAVYETWKSLSHVQLFVSPWTIQSREFSRPEDWSGQTFPRGSKPRSPALQLDSLPAELQGEPKNTGVGGLSLLQVIFLTQELNWGLLHCRGILYQLSYQGGPGTACIKITSDFRKLYSSKGRDAVTQLSFISVFCF